MAYRKAKVDFYYTEGADLQALLEYEESLEENLNKLHRHLLDEDAEWFASDEFLGDWTVAPKSISPQLHHNSLISSDPWQQWATICDEEQDKLKRWESGHNKTTEKPRGMPLAEFRLMAEPSIHFHVLSSLWMLKVGSRYEKHLAECAYGNRLRRTQEGKINTFSLGSFQPYLFQYRKWRDNGLRAMHSALEEDKKVVSITADVSSFYHELNPDFMLDERFLESVGISLGVASNTLNRIFISALKAWAQRTPLKRGLPVGLPASGIVANMALIELDRVIQKEVAPLYYGRYVDDIMLVMENGADFTSAGDVWEWLFKRSGGLLDWATKEKNGVAFRPEYLKDNSLVEFKNEKNKIFLLNGEHGKAMLGTLSHQIQEKSSEWRMLPCLPEKPEHIATELISVSQGDGEAADNLRKTDRLSMRRADFALTLRDFEAYARDLDPEAWEPHRKAFLEAFLRYVVAPPSFFDLAKYFPRVLQLAISCEDFEMAHRLNDQLDHLVRRVESECAFVLKGQVVSDDLSEEVLGRWKDKIHRMADLSIRTAMPVRISRKGKKQWSATSHESLRDIQDWHKRLFSHDLAVVPFRFSGLKELIDSRSAVSPKEYSFCSVLNLLPDILTERLSWLASRLKMIKECSLPFGLVFSTRPFSLQEMFLIHPEPYSEKGREEISGWIFALRGFGVVDKLPSWNERKGMLSVTKTDAETPQRIALASWKTDLNSWTASVAGKKDPDGTRYQRYADLLNGVIRSREKPSYLLLPELSVPPRWFVRYAHKLKGCGISLVGGVEYLHRRTKKVSNQVWAALKHDGLGFPSMMIYRQDKQRPAIHEERELFDLAGLKLVPVKKWKVPPVIQHGNFRFALLICSELTNIAYRSALRGKIDALFVPEWNPDTETFNALVESAALDIHAYIIQCNDRQYGDSRIRAPYKEQWQRDLVRIKGGLNDFFVIGQIDIPALRQFQSYHRSPKKPFKPVPDGFHEAMEEARKVLPDNLN